MDDSDNKKGHNPRQSGPKALKKKGKLRQKHEQQDLTARQRNPKAFAIQSATKAERSFRRTADIKTKKQHIPKVDRSAIEPPPLVIAVIGPPKVGKSTLLKGLIKNYTKQRLTNIQGPVTVVAGKNRRLTFIECNNDINCMIDVAKIADLALLLVDAKQGFEMEIFEFFNICQAIGFPRCMGVLNHLDVYKDGKAIRKRKKQLKHRFEVELYKGARLFYLSMLVNGEYLPNEIHNLCRFISVMKIIPLSWRANHPYIFADRMEDITNPESIRQNAKCDRTVSMYGYIRGTHMKSKSVVHLAGCGDYIIKTMTYLPDPCPTPDMEKRRSLNVRERVIYAPMSGVGGIVYDKDAVYIDMGDKKEAEEKPTGMVAALMDTLKTVDEKMKDSQISIFKGGPSISGTDFIRKVPGEESDDDDDDDDDKNDEDSGMDDETGDDDDDDADEEEMESTGTAKKKRKVNVDSDDDGGEDSMDDDDGDDSEDDGEESEGDGDEETGHLEWKKNMFERAKMGKSRKKNYFRIIYGEDDSTNKSDEDKDRDDENDDDLGGLFTVLKKGSTGNVRADKHAINKRDSSRSFTRSDLTFDELTAEIEDTFVTGKWQASEDAETLLKEDDELYGDFEDLETGESFQATEDNDANDINDDDDDEKDKVEDGEAKEETEEKVKTKAEKSAKEKRLERKRKMKDRFNAEYDSKGDEAFYEELRAEAEMQSKMNRAEFEELPEEQRVQYEGFRPGMYVRVEFDQMPCELVENFDPEYPLIIGGMTNVEEKLGYVNVRIKKHRWYKKILKSRNPLIISMGWRRFQTIPFYYKMGDNMRRRMLKYTPQHIHCNASFWGPVTPQTTGFFAVESVSAATPNFRIAATGVVLEMDKTTEVEKKLKLVGTPTKIFKKSAFIEKMFSSSLEVAKFEGARIQTVSRLRGQIKKALRTPPGAFRATFEDKIRMGDIVFLKAWVKVDIPKFIMPVTSLLLSHDAKQAWNGMRTIGTLRHERGIPVPQKQDSMYKPIQRKERIERPLYLPNALKKKLPFKDTPKDKAKLREPERKAIILEPKEAKIAKFMKRVKEVYNNKVAHDEQYKKRRAIEFGKRKEKEDGIRQQKLKEAKKRLHKILGDLQKRKDFKGNK